MTNDWRSFLCISQDNEFMRPVLADMGAIDEADRQAAVAK
jgi:hypothetical protein